MSSQEKVPHLGHLLSTNSSLTIPQHQSFFLISRHTYLEFEYMFVGFVIPLLSVFGAFANMTNIAVFAKMGLKETTNILFFVISIADLILLLAFIMAGCAVNAAFASINTIFLNPYEIVFIINPFTWACFGLGSCVTALVAVERSVCIMFPLKVKLIFTRGRILVSIGFCSALPLACLTLKFSLMSLSPMTIPETNQTGLTFDYSKYGQSIDLYATLAFSVVPSIISFVVVSLGTGFLVYKLNQSSRWRKSSSMAGQTEGVTSKEMKVIRSAILVCIVYIVCFAPNVGIISASLIQPRLHAVDPFYGPFMFMASHIANFFQCISSSLTFVYTYQPVQSLERLS